MQDRPSAGDLAEAVREFLEAEILPVLDDPRAKFRTRVSMNALNILERELEQEEALLREELARLADLLGKDPATPNSLKRLKERVIELNRDLAQSIRHGEVPEGTLEYLKQAVADKLQVASPSYLKRYD
jgi:uncharacterized small protein (DUF1192 family)